ncbi:hypothetical protein [Paenibacillus sp. FSL H8-0332]|uniref:hypothetical protein n=1 Tax=Paenibacillus sp. FSL H8-0332 TaxID=2954742 RepID=UPI0030CB83B9
MHGRGVCFLYIRGFAGGQPAGVANGLSSELSVCHLSIGYRNRGLVIGADHKLYLCIDLPLGYFDVRSEDLEDEAAGFLPAHYHPKAGESTSAAFIISSAEISVWHGFEIGMEDANDLEKDAPELCFSVLLAGCYDVSAAVFYGNP